MHKRLLVVLMMLGGTLLVACNTLAPTLAQPTPSPAFGKPMTIDVGTYRSASPEELNQMLANKDFQLINVYTSYAGEIPQTDSFIHYDEIEQNLSKLPADKNGKVVLYCYGGGLSPVAARTLLKLGYTNVWSLSGGMQAWRAAGLDLIRK